MKRRLNLGMTRAEYAAHRRCDPKEVRNALASGRIRLEPNGKIDPTKADAAWASNTNPASATKPKGKNQPAVTAAAVEAARDLLVAAGLTVSGGKMTFAEARTANEITKSLIGQLRLKEREGALVDRARAVEAIFSLARLERDGWQAWPARISAVLAADLHIDPHRLQTALDRLVRDHLASLSTVDVERALVNVRRTPMGIST